MSLLTSFSNAPLKRKLLLIGALSVGLAMLCISIVIAIDKWNERRVQAVSNLTTFAHMISANAASAMLFDDANAATKTLEALAADPNIVDAVIYDREGNVFAHFNPHQHAPGTLHLSLKPGSHLFSASRLTLAEPIWFNDKVLGSIYLEFDLRNMYADILFDIGLIFLIGSGAILAALLLFARLLKTIVAPIEELSNGMRKVSAEQNYALRVAVHGQDEIGLLARTFNDMLGRIQQRDTELARHREHLEEEVASRTASLAESERRFRAVAQSANDAIITSAGTGNIVGWNAAAERLFGYAEAEINGQPLTMLMPERFRSQHSEGLARVVAGGVPHVIGKTVELAGLRKDGSEFPLELSLSQWQANGQFFTALIRDITERKRTEAELLQLNDELEEKVFARTAQLEQARIELEQASRGKDEFLAAISHELKTPLNHILGFADLLKEGLAGELNAEQKDMAQDIFDAGNKQLGIVNSLIELARLQAGKVTLQTKPEDSAQMLGEIAAQYAAKAEAAGLNFAVEVAQGMGEMPLDREVVTHLLDQLLANAIKFTPSGGKISLTARRVPRSDVAAPVRIEAGEYLELAVTDNGPGIAPEILPRLFQPFVQGDGRLARSHGGTGIGLMLVRLLAELHGGGNRVESEPGAGAKFLVWLPCGASQPPNIT